MKAILLFLCLMGTGGLVAQNAASLGLQEQLIETWSNGSYQNAQRNTYTNNSEGFYDHIHGDVWNGSAWQALSQGDYTITPDGNVDTVTTQQWNADSNNWVNSTLTAWTYANGLISQIVTQLWVDNNWQNLTRSTYHYDTSGFLTQIDRDQWSAGTNTWALSSRESFTNSSAGLATGSVVQVYASGTQSWTDYSRDTNTYDGNGNLIYKLRELNIVGGWVNSMQSNYTFDSNQRKLQGVSQSWNNGGWINSGRETYTYGALGVSEHETSLISLYPNPAVDRLEIAGIGEAKLVDVYGIDGKNHKAQMFNNSVDISALAAGTYILSVETEKGISKAKFIKQ